MAAVIGSLRADLSASIAQFQSDLGKAATSLKKFSRDAKQVGGEIEQVGRSMSIAITLPLVALGVQAVRASREAKQAMASLQATIKSTGNASGKTAEQLAATSKELRNISTFQDDEILAGVTANLLRFGNVQGQVFDKAQKAILDLSAALGGDLQGNTIKVGRALQDPIKGIAALTRLGIQFTAAEKDQIKALTQAGEGMKAQEIILGRLEQKFGGAAKALRDASPDAALLNSWDDFAETIGDQLLPILTELAGQLSAALKWFVQLPAPIQKLAIGIAAVSAALGPLLAGFGFFIKMGGQIIGVLATMFTWFSSLSVVTLGWVAAIAAVGVALVVFWESAKKIMQGDFAGAWESAKNTAKKIAGEIKGIWDSVTTGQKAPGTAPGAAGQTVAPKPTFNLENEGDLKKRVAALKTLNDDIRDMSNKIASNLGELTLPKATTQANALNEQIDAFVAKAKDAGVNTVAFGAKIDGLRKRIEELRQAGLDKEAKAFGESVDSAAVAVSKFARGGAGELEEKLGSVDDAFKSLRDKIQNEIDANKELAASNETAAKSMERLEGLLGNLGEAHQSATEAAIRQYKAEQDLATLASKRNQLDAAHALEDLRQARGEGGPLGQNQRDMQDSARRLQEQQLATQTRLSELEHERAELVATNMDRQNDEQIENLNTEIGLQEQLYNLVTNTTAEQLVAVQRVDEAFSNFADDLSDQLADMISEWDGSLQGLNSVFKQLAKELFIKPGTDSISGALSGGLKSLFDTGTSASQGGGMSGLLSSFAGLFGGGGSLNPGEWGIAGENGPEPIFGGSHGLQVMSNGDAAGMGRGRTVNQTWIVNTPDANSFRASRRQISRQAKQTLDGS